MSDLIRTLTAEEIIAINENAVRELGLKDADYRQMGTENLEIFSLAKEIIALKREVKELRKLIGR